MVASADINQLINQSVNQLLFCHSQPAGALSDILFSNFIDKTIHNDNYLDLARWWQIQMHARHACVHMNQHALMRTADQDAQTIMEVQIIQPFVAVCNDAA